MTAAFVLLCLVVVAALVFDFINGFHDTANAVATVVSTGVLPMRTAILLAALFNFVGALSGTAVATTVGKGLVAGDVVTQTVVLSALLGAIFWNLFTWYFGIPSSSSHALVGGLIGSAVMKAGTTAVQSQGVEKVVNSLIISPFIGFFLGLFIMIGLYWILRHTRPHRVAVLFRKLQMISAGFMAFSHGSNDAQKTMGIITMSLVAYNATGAQKEFAVPMWVVLACAAAMAAGTAAGGVRIIRTLGAKIIELKPIHGFAAETSAALTILGASHLGLPVSTTHVISSAIMGVGSSRRVSAVRWGVTAKILWAWVLTIPISAAVSALCYATARHLAE